MFFTGDLKGHAQLLLSQLLTKYSSNPDQPEPPQPEPVPAQPVDVVVEPADETAEEPAPKRQRQSALHAMYAAIIGRQEPAADAGGGHDATFQKNMYLSEKVIDLKLCPFAYWQREKRFPALARAAQVYLGAPCTSVNSERLFSTAAQIIDEKRNRLTAKNAEMLIFTKVNLPMFLESHG